MSFEHWCSAQPLSTERLTLEPLRIDDADEMAPVLDDIRLHTFVGGTPATREQLRARFERQVPGRSPNGSQLWFNWVVRLRVDKHVLGMMQATVSEEHTVLVGEIAWVIGIAYQGYGFAREAAAAMVAWLGSQGVEVVVAHVHPQHHASAAVARSLGLIPTNTLVDGEVRWERLMSRC